MERTEIRSVTVRYCDGCKEEADYLDRCQICGKDFCKQTGKRHFAFQIEELFRYKDQQPIYSLKVCVDCAKLPAATIGEFLDRVIDKALTTKEP